MPVNRRSFIAQSWRFAAAALTAVSGGLGVATLQGARPKRRWLRIRLAKLAAIAAPGQVVAAEVFLRPDALKKPPLHARCTHLGCRLHVDAAARELRCPCHGSRFDLEGAVRAGPATRPLARLSTRPTTDGLEVAIDPANGSGASHG